MGGGYVDASRPHDLWAAYKCDPRRKPCGYLKVSIDNNSARLTDEIIAIDVYDSTANVILGIRHIRRNEWMVTNTYQVFEVPFTKISSSVSNLIEFRVWHYRGAYVRVQKIGFY